MEPRHDVGGREARPRDALTPLAALRLRRPRLLALGAAAAALFAGATLLDRLADAVIFQPSPGIDLTPEDLGVPGEQVFLEAEDGVRLHAFYLPGRPDADRALLFLHGNAGNASHRLPNAAALAGLGTDVLLLDYRGYGRSEGTPSEPGIYTDSRAGLAHLLGERGFAAQRVVVFGRSLGAAVAVELAAGRELAGLILESAFPSAAAVARAAFGPLVVPLVRGRLEAERRIGEVRCPLLFFHGDRDDIVPVELGRRLFDAAPEPKVFEVLRGAGHNDTVEVGGRPYFERIGRFLEKVTPGDGEGERGRW